MTGKEKCKILREIRQKIADENDIQFVTEACMYKGECQGTCPKCEAELHYLELELKKKGKLQKIATAAGISMAMAACQSNIEVPLCNTTSENQMESVADQMNCKNSSTPQPVVICHYSESKLPADVMGDVAYEPSPTHKEVVQKLQPYIVYPQCMIDKKIECTAILSFSYDSSVHIQDVEIQSNGDSVFSEAIREALIHLNEAFENIEYDQQYYKIPIEFRLSNHIDNDKKGKTFFERLKFWK